MCIRPKASSKQAIGVQLAQPCCIAYVGLAARDILGVASIHQNDLEAVLLQNLISRYPVDTRGLHGDAGDPAGFEPVSEIVQIVGKSPEGADWHVISVRVDGGHMHCRADIDGGGSWVHAP